jgi:hypothetical protein
VHIIEGKVPLKPPSKQLEQFVVRLPDGMREQMKASAERNKRSMNAEIVSAIELWLNLENLGPSNNSVEEPSQVDEKPVKEDPIVAHFVNGPDDVERAIAQMTDRYKADLRKAMLAMIPSSQKAKE